MALLLFLLICFNILKSLSCTSLTVTGYCGDPGRPTKSQLSPTQNTYNGEETITYKCDDYISLKQYRKCVRGKWRGEPAVCGNAFRDNDVKRAKIYRKSDGFLIKEYNTSALPPFTKFGTSFIAERYDIPLRAFGAESYRIELYLQYKAIFQLVRISLSLVNHLVDPRLRKSSFNITKVTISPYRECRLHTQSNVSPWLHNSTRFDYWFSCESKDQKSFEKEIKEKSDLVVIETESDDQLELDLATFILAQPYTTDGNIKQQICGTPEIPIGLFSHVINHNTRYAFKCDEGFRPVEPKFSDAVIPSFDLFCSTDMKWKGRLPECLPKMTCKKFSLTEKHLIEVYVYEKVYYYNESHWFAIEGTKAYFRCKEETQIFVGKEIRVCGKDGLWSDSLPNCLETDKESKVNLTNLSIIILMALFVTFGLTAILIYCGMRWKRMRSNERKDTGRRESNIYDDYDFTGQEGKAIDENYETVDDDRYATRAIPPIYTPMTGGSYKYNYHDRNVYDDCAEYHPHQQNPNALDVEESYVVMKKY